MTFPVVFNLLWGQDAHWQYVPAQQHGAASVGVLWQTYVTV